ncbi:MAG: bifunctional DNA-binding transcriptional regulator/O6-methylguanine-DNA methyltransferase Ada [Acidobacteriaceae bacterium]
MTVASNAHDTDAQRWQAVLAHDRAGDGRFFYAVKTTGIYCRPSCPSRRPNSVYKVEFFGDHISAEMAGFRACQRCKPREVSAQTALVERVSQILRERADQRFTLEELAATCGVSPFHLQRTFKRFTGLSPREYQNAQRAQRFKQSLRSEPSVTDAVYAAGFASSSRAYEGTYHRLGMTPAQYRKHGGGQSVHYTVFVSDFGQVLIAATDKGVCSLRLGNSEQRLVRELNEEFRAAKLVRNDVRLQPFVDIVQRYLAGFADTPELPLDVRASAFQARVWYALQRIPAGETRTYSDVAAQLGEPKAVRAVARACATNPVALAVPCHRVVAKSGALSGYRWGTERKRQILQREAHHARRKTPALTMSAQAVASGGKDN